MPGQPRPNRREVLMTCAGTAATALAGPLGAVLPVLAQGIGTTPVGAAARRIPLGSREIIVLSDGHMVVPSTMLAGNVPETELRAFLATRSMGSDRVDFHINVALIKTGSDLVLIDAGAGLNWEPTAGKLVDSLERSGIRPELIGTVVLTHAHPDHVWGLIDELDESLRFANAKYVMSEREFEFWMSGAAANLRGPIEGIAAGAKRVLKAIEGRLQRIKPGAEAAPGIIAIDTAGHTPGHISLLVESGSEKVLVTGDAIQNAHVSFAHPEWQPRADMDGEKAIVSRRAVLDMAAADKLSVISYHIPFPGLGRVERKGTAYSWTTAV